MNAVPAEAAEGLHDAIARLMRRALRDGDNARVRQYRDADGRELFCAVRLCHADGSKDMRPIHRGGDGRYTLGRGDKPPEGWPLYRLPELLAAPADAPVWIVEGEACTDALRKLGLAATTSGSATSADAGDWTPLRGRSCVVWPDRDGPGAAYATAVVAKLRALGCEVRLVSSEIVESLPAHGDCVDWLAQQPGATRADVEALPLLLAPERSAASADAPRVELVNAADVKPERIRWLWPDWLARGKLHVIAGAPGTGKTTIALRWAACVSAGLPFPSGWKPTPGRVLIWSGEDSIADTLVPRLMAMGADLSRVQFVGDVRDGSQRYPFDPARDVPTLAAALAGADDVALIQVDPLVSAVAADSHKNAEVRRSLAPLVELAQRVDAALLGVTHYSKGTQGREPLERVTGSLAFGALARLVFGTVKQKADDSAPSRYLLARVKSNIGPDGGGYAYEFKQTELTDGIEASRVVFGESVEGSARELLAEAEADDDKTESGECSEWLSDELSSGERDAKDMQREGARLGYSRKVIRRAREKLKIKPRRIGFGRGSRVVWELPPIDAQNPIDAHSKKWASMAPMGTYVSDSAPVAQRSEGDAPPDNGPETVEI